MDGFRARDEIREGRAERERSGVVVWFRLPSMLKGEWEKASVCLLYI